MSKIHYKENAPQTRLKAAHDYNPACGYDNGYYKVRVSNNRSNVTCKNCQRLDNRNGLQIAVDHFCNEEGI